jgi:ATP synthase protein I
MSEAKQSSRTEGTKQDPGKKLQISAEQMVGKVGVGQRRMLEARAKRNHDFYHSLAILGVVGWSITFPTLAGVALGIWIDRMYPSRLSWTLMLLFAGLAIGCWNAWSHIKQYSKG